VPDVPGGGRARAGHVVSACWILSTAGFLMVLDTRDLKEAKALLNELAA
jgi:hypothetical protein